MLRISLILCGFILSIYSCKEKYNDPLRGYIIDLKGTNIIQNNLDPVNLVISFDGTCSGCIIEFIEFIIEWNRDKLTDIPCFIIVMDQDLYHVQYLLDEFEIQLTNNQLMSADSTYTFLKNNSKINDFWNLLLIDNDKAVITSGNPFGHTEVYDIYIQLNLLR